MNKLRLIAIILFVALAPVFLVTSNVRWVINAPVLYSYGFDKYDIPTYTGIERGELLSAARQIRGYFNNDEEFITISVVVRGVRVLNLYNEREVLHMKDVKGLVKGVYLIQTLSGAYLAAFAVAGLVIWRRAFIPRLARYVSLGGALTLGLVVLVGLASLVGFDRLFLAFHLVSFSNDLWQLDPSRDYLIAMFPEGFFFDATMWIAGATVVEALLLTAVPLALLRWKGQRGAQYVEGRVITKTQAR
jgi:integral membrane protein (TIGR01906 family)